LWNEHLMHDGLIPALRDEAAAREDSALARALDAEVRALLRVDAELERQGMKPPPLHPVTAEVLGGGGLTHGAR